MLFRDDRLAILDKPAGLAVHAGRADPGARTVEDSFAMFGPRRAGPWLAHRLDRDTSGCLVVALRRRTLVELQRAFAAGRVRKTYWAVVAGDPGEGGVMRARLGRVDGPGRSWRMAEMPGGEEAETAWRRLATGGGMSWLRLEPRTGRTHQIRAHCLMLGTPVLGDPVYGDPVHDDGGATIRTQLHARRIVLPLEPPVAGTSPMPVAMAAILCAAGIDPRPGPEPD